MERKFTDDEIVKALGCCSDTGCEECPINNKSIMCATRLMEHALDLINRQKAENERLTETSEEAVSCFHRMESLYNIKCMELKVAKTEAYKEFAERVKAKAMLQHGGVTVVYGSNIDNLVKEMTGGKT